VLLTFATVIMPVAHAFAQGTFPAPLLGDATSPANNGWPFQQATGKLPPGDGPDDCMTEFKPLRDEAEQRGHLLKIASDRHAPADETCKLIGRPTRADAKSRRRFPTNSGLATRKPRPCKLKFVETRKRRYRTTQPSMTCWGRPRENLPGRSAITAGKSTELSPKGA
jgi:hypothetical protein